LFSLIINFRKRGDVNVNGPDYARHEIVLCSLQIMFDVFKAGADFEFIFLPTGVLHLHSFSSNVSSILTYAWVNLNLALS